MIHSLLISIALSGSPVTTGPEPDPRWRAWLGCWQPAGADWNRTRDSDPSSYYACVIPTANPAAVEIVTVDNGAVAGRETIQVTGDREKSSRGGCTGWESAEWSPEQTRVYLTSEQTCGNGLVRKSSGLLSITASGDWLDVRGLSSGGNSGVRVLRYRAVDFEAIGDHIPAEISNALEERTQAIATARMAAGRRLHVEDVIEVSKRLEAPVVQAWLIDTRQGFGIEGKDLARLADAGVPGSVTDIIVALSYPRVFAIDPDARASEVRRPEQQPTAPVSYPDPGIISVWDPFGYSPFGYPGYYPYGPFGYGGYGWYSGSRPIVLVADAPTSTTEQNGQAVKGRGYRKNGGDNSGSGSSGNSNHPSSSSGNSGSSGGSTSSAPASSGSSGSGSGRTAHPRN
jgi:hypothetical protein